MERPFGIKILKSIIGAPFNSTVIEMIVDVTDATPLFINDPVKSLGQTDDTGIQFCTKATPGDSIRGIVVGFVGERRYENDVYRLSYIRRSVKVCEDYNILCSVQVNAALTDTDIGKYINIDNGAGNTIYGVSEVALDYATISSSDGQFKILQIEEIVDTDYEEYSIVKCMISKHELFAYPLVNIPNQDNIYYVGKHGHDTGYDGKNIEHAFLTLQAGIDAAAAEPPSETNQFVVKVMDNGDYESFSLDSIEYVNIDAHSARIVDDVNIIGDNSVVRLGDVRFSGVGGNLITKNGTGTSYLYANKLFHTTTGSEVLIFVGNGTLYSSVNEVKCKGLAVTDYAIIIGSDAPTYGKLYHIGDNIYGRVILNPGSEAHIYVNELTGDIELIGDAVASITINGIFTGSITTDVGSKLQLVVGERASGYSDSINAASDVRIICLVGGDSSIEGTLTIGGNSTSGGVLKLINSSNVERIELNSNDLSFIREPLSYRKKIYNHETGTHNVTVDETGYLFHADLAIAATTFSLPLAVTGNDGIFFDFYVIKSLQISITPSVGTIKFGPLHVSTDIHSSEDGAFLRICQISNEWTVTQVMGNWVITTI